MKKKKKKKKLNKVLCDADELNIYSLKECHFAVLLFHILITQSQPNPFQLSVAADCGLPVCSLQDVKGIREDEETPADRGTSTPGTWRFCFRQVLNSTWVHTDAIVCDLLT